LIINNALLHAPSEILAQKSCAVAEIGDPDRRRGAVCMSGSPIPATAQDFCAKISLGA